MCHLTAVCMFGRRCTFCLQGHSLGGSLATLLLVMYLRRGVLPAVAASPAYTFGAPAVFCEGNCSPAACRVPDTADHEVLPPLQQGRMKLT